MAPPKLLPDAIPPALPEGDSPIDAFREAPAAILAMRSPHKECAKKSGCSDYGCWAAEELAS